MSTPRARTPGHARFWRVIPAANPLWLDAGTFGDATIRQLFEARATHSSRRSQARR